MKISIRKDFCVWLVSPSDGTVKKLRFTSRRALLVMTGVVLFGLGVVFLAGDYARVQMLRAKEYFSMVRVTQERNELLSDKSSLETKVKGLETENFRVMNYERNLRGRISELSSVLESAESFGVLSKKEFDKIGFDSGRPEDGMGGAFLDCSSGNRGSCSPEAQAKWSDSKRTMFSVSRFNRNSSENLIEKLDVYIEALNKVPFMVPVIGHLSSAFGMRRSPFSRRREMHEGMDFSLPYGSEILATADGVVKNVKWSRGYGLMVDLSHGTNVQTRFGHLSKALVKKGQKICQGQLIGLVGSSGRSTGPHLHYEVRVNDKPLNPMKLFELGQLLHGVL